MTEGVIAIDNQERLINVNQAAGMLLDINTETPPDRTIQEVIRNLDLQDFISRQLNAEDPLETELIIHYAGEDRSIQAYGTRLCNAKGGGIGALIVLHDVTRLRRLELVRRDFVANVSHELKTPITTLKGFIETLLEGAMDEPENARHFLGIMSKNADRLSSIIEDLLSLSRIEQESDRDAVTLTQSELPHKK
ncbi:MAG: PAS domain-containing protein [Kiritimatiellae bacterium]|nr:PAS domain-containing protein [Kiritimatiellia bacterium]